MNIPKIQRQVSICEMAKSKRLKPKPASGVPHFSESFQENEGLSVYVNQTTRTSRHASIKSEKNISGSKSGESVDNGSDFPLLYVPDCPPLLNEVIEEKNRSYQYKDLLKCQADRMYNRIHNIRSIIVHNSVLSTIPPSFYPLMPKRHITSQATLNIMTPSRGIASPHRLLTPKMRAKSIVGLKPGSKKSLVLENKSSTDLKTFSAGETLVSKLPGSITDLKEIALDNFDSEICNDFESNKKLGESKLDLTESLVKKNSAKMASLSKESNRHVLYMSRKDKKQIIMTVKPTPTVRRRRVMNKDLEFHIPTNIPLPSQICTIQQQMDEVGRIMRLMRRNGISMNEKMVKGGILMPRDVKKWNIEPRPKRMGRKLILPVDPFSEPVLNRAFIARLRPKSTESILTVTEDDQDPSAQKLKEKGKERPKKRGLSLFGRPNGIEEREGEEDSKFHYIKAKTKTYWTPKEVIRIKQVTKENCDSRKEKSKLKATAKVDHSYEKTFGVMALSEYLDKKMTATAEANPYFTHNQWFPSDFSAGYLGNRFGSDVGGSRTPSGRPRSRVSFSGIHPSDIKMSQRMIRAASDIENKVIHIPICNQ